MYFLRLCSTASIIIAALVHAEEQIPLNSEKQEWKVGQVVKTTSGRLQGHSSPTFPSISEYLGIPYAQAPLKSLRFAAPKAYKAENDGALFIADKFSPDCPPSMFDFSDEEQQKLSEDPISRFLIAMRPVGQGLSEDCLKVNVWTRGKSSDKRGKAVLLWIHGGGFEGGGTGNAAFDGAPLVDENDVVVVTMGYRLSILGFPSAPGLPDYNLGLLDQRLAVEWTRDNIANFGGDPSRITLFGQSAGGASVDMHAYAWPDDPIVNALIPQSGAAGLVQTDASTGASNWFKLASKVGCGNQTDEATLECMRRQEYSVLIKAIKGKAESRVGLPSISFGPMIDNKIVFADYQERAAAGKFAKRPVLVGATDNEAGLIDYLSIALTGKGLNRVVRYTMNKVGFTCPSGLIAQERSVHNVSAYRYRYFGDYPNTRIGPKAGAYHASELTMVFGTTSANIHSEKFGDIEDTDAEVKTGKLMRRAWSTFAKDPEDGLTRELGWPRYDPRGNTLIRLGFQNDTEASFVKSTEFDAGCGIARVAMKHFGHFVMRGRVGKDDIESTDEL